MSTTTDLQLTLTLAISLFKFYNLCFGFYYAVNRRNHLYVIAPGFYRNVAWLFVRNTEQFAWFGNHTKILLLRQIHTHLLRFCNLNTSLFAFQTFRLLHEEGFYVGASSGLNVIAAVQVAKKLGPGHTVVTCLCDTGQRYFTRLYSKSWLKEKGLLDVIPEQHRLSLIE